jgi:hypothetical protein
MTLRLQTFLTGLLVLLTAALLAFAPASTNAASGGYQLFERVNYGITDDNSLTALGNFDYHAKIASECCIAPNRTVPDGWRPVTGVGAQVNTPRGFTTYRTPDGDLVHVSPGGLQYGADPKFGNRVDHVLDHTAPNPNKPVHSVFNAQGDDALNLVDEAWANRSGAGTLQANGNRTWTVDLGRPVGTTGQTSVQIVVRDGTNELITAFPQ